MAVDRDQASAAHTGPARGRRHRRAGVDRVQTTVWLEPGDSANLEALAEAGGMTRAEVMEKLIRREMERRTKRMLQCIAV
jgi:hypothetical protein